MQLRHSLLAAAAVLALCAAAPAQPAAPGAQSTAPAATPWMLTYREVGFRVRTFTLDSSGHATMQSGTAAPESVSVPPAKLAAIAASIDAVDGSRWTALAVHPRLVPPKAPVDVQTESYLTQTGGGAFGDVPSIIQTKPDAPSLYPPLSSQPMVFLTIHRLIAGTPTTWSASWQAFEPTTEPAAAIDLGSLVAKTFAR